MSQARLALLERRTEELEEWMERVEGAVWSPPAPERVVSAPTPPAAGVSTASSGRADRARAARSPAPSLEDLLGGRVLAWIGGLAVLVGVSFLFAVAVSRGWIGEGARTLIAASGSLALLATGVWLRETRGRAEAAVAAVAAATGALFMTVTVAAQVYELVPVGVALAMALAVGATTTVLAVRWSAAVIGALGIVGGLLSPVLVGAPTSGSTLALLLVAGLSAVGVLVWQRWDWLALIVVGLSAVQWLEWLFAAPSLAGAFLVLVAFGALGVAAAIGFELRVPTARLRPSSSFLLVLNALVLAVAGWLAFTDMDHRHLGEAWLAGLAVAHLGVGLSASRLRRVSRALGMLVLTLGVVLADTAFALIVSGPALAIGWAAGGVAFATILRRSTRRGDDPLLGLGLGGHLALAIIQALAGAAPLHALWAGPGEPVGAILSLSAIAAGCFVSARIAEDGRADWARALDILGLVVVAYLTAVSLDGPPLVVAWSIEAAGLAALARRTGAELPAAGAAAYVTGALAHALAFEAPPTALVEGLDAPGAAAISLGAASAAALWCARLRAGGSRAAQAFAATGAVALLYLASSALVTPFQPGGGAVEATLLDLGVREQGQLLLSVFWSVVGVVALVVGLRRDVRPVRLGALSLLLFTVAKVFLYDLSTLTSIYRVTSFIGLGLVLLGAAYAWQRMRPEALEGPDRAR